MQLDFSVRSLGPPFLILWAGTTVSLFGKMLTSFALNVWVFQKSGSVLIYSGMVAATTLPALLILPWSGNFADRVNRRYVLVISSGSSIILALALAALLWYDQLAIWHLYAFNVFVAAIAAFENPAYQATVSSLLSKEQLTRGVGLIGLSSNLFATLAHMAAGGLLGYIKLQGIVSIDIFMACNAVLSICILLGGSSNSLVLYSSCAFIAMLAGAVGGGCSTSLWMRKLPLERQGSIFALVGTITLVMNLIVTVAGGFIADHVFEPALASGGVLVDSVGIWLNMGKGKGLSLVFVLCGFLGVLLSLGALMHKQFRNMESFVPDGR
jgi:MFS family permease